MEGGWVILDQSYTFSLIYLTGFLQRQNGGEENYENGFEFPFKTQGMNEVKQREYTNFGAKLQILKPIKVW